MKRAVPWGDYALRALACILLFISGALLTMQSTFALRLRSDVPATVSGFDAGQGIALAITAALSLVPLLFGRRFLGAFLVSAFIITGIGAYWWTTIPWDELVTESDFTAGRAPRVIDYALTLAPVFIAAFYAAVSRASVLKADYLRRGADADEARRAAAASFLAGSAALVLSTLLTAALVALLASGMLRGIPGLVGVPALVVVGLLVVLAYIFGSGSFVVGRKAAKARPEDAKREADAAGKAATGRRRRAPS